MWLSSDVTWTPRVEYSLPAPSHRQLSKKRPAKVGSRTRRRPDARLFHSWTGKRIPQLVTNSIKDEEKIAMCSRSDSLVPKFLRDSESDSIGYRSCNKETFPHINGVVEEPWLPLASVHAAEMDKKNDVDDGKEILKFVNGHHQGSKCLDHNDQFDVNEVKSAERHDCLLSNYPVEEPWIFESSTCGIHSSVQIDSDVSSNEYPDDKLIPAVVDRQHQLMPETLLQEEESNVTAEEDSVSTVILINSSLCTMQRIAVIENDELVELLLEPVKSTVQCDSVYLGVLTKLVPHMGGAFINIGSSRPSFMDIKPNREPFILTSLHDRMKELETDVHISDKAAEHAEIPIFANRDADQDECEDDQSEDEFTGDEFVGDENLFHLNVIESIKENLNGSVGRYEHDIDTNGIAEPLSEDVVKRHSNWKSNGKCLSAEENKWAQVQEGSMIIVQVVKEGLGTKGPTLTAYPKLKSRFWVLIARSNTIGISKKIYGVERTRLRVIAKSLQPPGFGLTVRTVASGQSLEELQKDLEGLLSTWKSIVDHAKSAALAADEGVDGAVPVMLHRAMGQTLSIVQDYFNEKVKSMVVNSPRTYHEVTNYLQEIAPDLCDRVELYNKRTPLFDEYKIEDEISSILSKRVPLANGGYLVIEQTEALVSIDVNGGQCMLGQGTSQEKAILEVNLAAAKQIARELRLRDIGGIIVVDFIDMVDDSNKRLVYEEVKKAVERDPSIVKISELSRHGLMEITRKRVRPSVTFMISEPCTCCHATGRVEALETTFSKIEHEICRLLSTMDQKADPGNSKSWPRLILRVDRHMCNYLTSGKRTRLALLSSSLKVWILLKVARGLTRGTYELKPLTEESLQENQHHTAIPVLRPTDVVTYSPTRSKVTFFPIKKVKRHWIL